ncbi:MAG: DUF488 domain-containing protein [Gemmatimonadaceae bacterium]|nr:DUF488 domain-containing protein [Gemmatimonadaceae bacterium]
MSILFTVGFTQKSAERFFDLLTVAGVRKVIDTRLNNRSQLAGFTKADDLPFFLRKIGGIDYRHAPEMAPTQEMLDRYKKLKGSWAEYEIEFNQLLTLRKLEKLLSLSELEHACLLCSEHEPDKCHRRLVAEYIQARHSNFELVHLV